MSSKKETRNMKLKRYGAFASLTHRPQGRGLPLISSREVKRAIEKLAPIWGRRLHSPPSFVLYFLAVQQASSLGLVKLYVGVQARREGKEALARPGAPSFNPSRAANPQFHAKQTRTSAM